VRLTSYEAPRYEVLEGTITAIIIHTI